MSMCSIPYFTGKPKCFPAMTKIKLKNGKMIMMSDLKEEHKVQTGNRKNL